MKRQGFETKMVHAGYEGNDATHSVAPPLYLTNAYYFDDTAHAQSLFELKQTGNIYSRLGNPTCYVLEDRLTALEGGVGALSFSSGHAAIFNVIANLCVAGDEVVSSRDIYGGVINMIGISLNRLGVKVKFVEPGDMDAWKNSISPKTRLFFTELVGNPHGNISDIETIAEIAHKNGIPFMVDGTFNTPYLCRPFDWGADFVVHSATKYLSGHGQVMGGIVVDGGTFDFKGNPRFPLFNSPDVSYHGMVFADLGKAGFLTRLRALIMRDFGSCLSPFNAYIILIGVETLSLRMERHCQNALKVAEFLESRREIETVNCAMLKSSEQHGLQQKYMTKGSGGIFTFDIKGDKLKAAKFLDSLKLIQIVANVGDIRTQVSHPATTTHSQLSAEHLKESRIKESTVRITVGIETVEDIIEDLKQAIESINY
ncbi:MAG: O-acetylhomoserine aminocarboxypropyltransferase/cysteine synthase [Eubacterium sp.]|jgi:O-acetylhomoserine (thiol)-lyase|nr:O-acetylhomoserine aminocarboxypropyltransferase/cysteine synthase [Eubacterium sp.]